MQDDCKAERLVARLLLLAPVEIEFFIDVVLDGVVVASIVVSVVGYSNIFVLGEQVVEFGEALSCCVENLIEV